MAVITFFVKRSANIPPDATGKKGKRGSEPRPYASVRKDNHTAHYIYYDQIEELENSPRNSVRGNVAVVIGISAATGILHEQLMLRVRKAAWFEDDLSVIVVAGHSRSGFNSPLNESGGGWNISTLPANTTAEEFRGHLNVVLILRSLQLPGNTGVQSIIRSIEFPPEYYQSGVTILSYFASVLREKNLSNNVKVAIEQEGLLVRLIIEAPTGQRELIEQTLESYALVVSGQSPLEDLLMSPRGLIELRSQLSIALAQLQTSRDLLRYVDEDRSALQAQLKETSQALERVQRRADSDAERFMAILGTLVNNNSGLAQTLGSLSEKAMSGNNVALSEALSALKTMVDRGLNEDDKEEFIQKVQIVKSEDRSFFNKLSEVIRGTASGAGGRLLYDWIKIVIESLPK